MNSPKLSVVTVVYNGVQQIEKTIKSVISQDYHNIEYIIIDGGSSDGTIDIIKKYNNEVAVWISEPDRGVYDAMNKAISLATGVWINFMNAGDCFCDNKVISKLFSHEGIQEYSFLYSDFYVLRKDNRKLVESSYEKGVLLHQSVIYKKELHDFYGKYLITPQYIVSDYLFFNQISQEKIKKIDIPISVNNEAGVSGGTWCWYQKLCFDYIFRRISMPKLMILLSIRLMKNIVLKLICYR